MGGPSAEHEVSLATGREILLNLDRKKYSARAVVISHQRKFYFCDITDNVPDPEEFANPENAQRFKGPFDASLSQPVWESTDIALLGMHGEFGEDGVIQGFLETIGVPYTGSGVLASAVGMDKIATKRIFEAIGLSTPPSSIYRQGNPMIDAESLAGKHGFPCFVKCPQSGSSRLMGRAQDVAGLAELLAELSAYSDTLLVETAITGDEFSCPVFEQPDGALHALPPILIRPVGSSFFDYRAKYTGGASEEIVPAPCSEEITHRIQDIALKTHRALGCRGLTRTDMILSDNTFFVLEINTLPGLTPASLAPKAYCASGGTYPQLLDILIQTAFKKKRQIAKH
jgi:D-alanine-D-alanine ligase